MADYAPAWPLPWLTENWDRLHSQLVQNRLAHAYLLCGERGLGKNLFARAAAALLLCENPNGKQPCGTCRQCLLRGQDQNTNNNPDLLYIEPEEGGRVIKVDQIRAMIGFTEKTSHANGRKIVILSQADRLHLSAANALLKTLEEPPGSTFLFLLSDSPGRLLPTLRSRCQRILFSTPASDLALQWLHNSLGENPAWPSMLNLAGGKPLLVKEYLESDEMAQRQLILRVLHKVVEGTLDPVDFATAGRSSNPLSIMECLWQSSVVIIKYLLYRDDALLASSEIRAIVNLLSASTKDSNIVLSRLLQLNQAAEDARSHLLSSSNPNPQLLIEGIIWRWSRLAS